MKKIILSVYALMAFTMTSVAQTCPTWASNEPANNSISTAPVMNLYPHWEQSTISSTTDVDYYKFTIPSQGYFDLMLSPNYVDLDLMLIDRNGSLISYSNKGGTEREVITYNVVTPGTYYIKVFGYQGAYSTQGCYSVGATFFAGQCRDIYEPNNSFTQAKYLSLATNIKITGSIDSPVDQDWFTFTISTSKPHFEIILSNLVVDLDMELFNANGVSLQKYQLDGTASERIYWSSAGTYKLKIYGYNNASARQCYELSVKTSNCVGQCFRTAEESTSLGNSNKENTKATTVFPNPALSGQHVYINVASAGTIRILNLQGQVVSEQNITEQDGKAAVSLQGIEPGLYLLDAGDAGKHKFVVQ